MTDGNTFKSQLVYMMLFRRSPDYANISSFMHLKVFFFSFVFLFVIKEQLFLLFRSRMTNDNGGRRCQFDYQRVNNYPLIKRRIFLPLGESATRFANASGRAFTDSPVARLIHTTHKDTHSCACHTAKLRHSFPSRHLVY